MLEQPKLEKMDDFLQKLETVVRIVLYGPAIGQSNCKKAGLYPLAYNKVQCMLVQQLFIGLSNNLMFLLTVAEMIQSVEETDKVILSKILCDFANILKLRKWRLHT